MGDPEQCLSLEEVFLIRKHGSLQCRGKKIDLGFGQSCVQILLVTYPLFFLGSLSVTLRTCFLVSEKGTRTPGSG